MHFYSHAVMGRQQSDSSNACYEDMAANPESVTDKLRSYGVAQRALIPDTIHNT